MARQRTNAVSTADVAALSGAPAAPAPVKRPAPYLSEGMRSDLETLGWAIDPVSGARYDVDRSTGEVTMREKDTTNQATGEVSKGKVSTVDVPVTVPPPVTDPETGEILVTNPETGVTTATNPETGESRIVE